jgi:2-methylisocitrate lyase-like PEP mutase family enzyme
VNVLTLPGVPPVPELASVGVARVSVGSAFANVAIGAVARAATQLKNEGTYEYLTLASEGSKAARAAFQH